MASRNKDQHFVPESYLAAWTDPDTPAGHEPFVHLFSRDGTAHKKRAPANVLKQKDLYTIFNGQDRDLRIEDTFAIWEKEFVRVRRKLDVEDFGDGDDAADLFAFVGAMLARPPQRIAHHKQQWEHILKVARSIKINPDAPPLPRIPSSDGQSLSIAEVQSFVDAPMATWFPENVAASVEAISTLFGCDVLVNVSEHPFLTSDSPATIYHPPRKAGAIYPRGLKWPGCEITFPISPRMALLFRHKKPGIHAFINADWEAVFQMNFRTITRARSVFVSNTDDVYFVKTIVDKVAKVDGANDRSG